MVCQRPAVSRDIRVSQGMSISFREKDTDYITYWGRVTHICVSRLTITGSDNGLSPGRRQAIIWTNAGILLIGSLGTNFSENLIEVLTFSFTKMRLKVSSAKWRPFCLGLNVISQKQPDNPLSAVAAFLPRSSQPHDDVMTWKCIPHHRWSPFTNGRQ